MFETMYVLKFVCTHVCGQIILAIPEATFTSIGLIEAALTLMSTSSGPLIFGTGRSRIWYSSGLQYFSIDSDFIEARSC